MVQFIRDGKIVWPYCDECGCRLDIMNIKGLYTVSHFGQMGWDRKDSRGCRCSKLEHWSFLNHKIAEIFI